MPQMKPMIWLIMMLMTLMMIMMTIIINFFTIMETSNNMKTKKIKLIKWKW
uniref:ATP synthase F0 subunit 8 n=1 Tax=Andrena subopaca TaxID=444410 RepID=A0A0S2LSD4_9HYME|nr:ATP synthase F0 subunit 8 [Andrena subopaca]